MRKGRLWRFFHPRGYTRKLTPDEVISSQSASVDAFLVLECHQCDSTLRLNWKDLPNLAKMNPMEQHEFIMNNDERTYQCRNCGTEYLVTWDGDKVTLMQACKWRQTRS